MTGTGQTGTNNIGTTQEGRDNSHTGFAYLFKSSRHRGVLFIALFSYMSLGLLMQVFPPVLQVIQGEYNLDHATVSLIMTLFLAPMAAIALPGGSLVDRYGVRRIGIIAFPLMAVGGLITALIPVFSFLILGRILSGVGGGLLLVSVLKLLTETFPQRQHGLAFGLFIAGLPIGTGVAFDILTPLNYLLRWQGETIIAVGVILVVWAAFVRAVPRRRKEGEEKYVHRGSIRAILRNGSILHLILSVIIGYTVIIGFTTWAPSTLVNYAHIPLWLSTVIASILLLIDIPLGPFWGAVSDRLGKRKFFILLAFVIYFSGSLFVPFVPRISSWIVAPALIGIVGTMGTGCSMFFPSALTIPAQSTTTENTGAAYGLFFTAQVIGMLLGPLLIGFILDASSPFVAFLSVSIITFAGLIASLAIRSK